LMSVLPQILSKDAALNLSLGGVSRKAGSWNLVLLRKPVLTRSLPERLAQQSRLILVLYRLVLLRKPVLTRSLPERLAQQSRLILVLYRLGLA